MPGSRRQAAKYRSTQDAKTNSPVKRTGSPNAASRLSVRTGIRLTTGDTGKRPRMSGTCPLSPFDCRWRQVDRASGCANRTLRGRGVSRQPSASSPCRHFDRRRWPVMFLHAIDHFQISGAGPPRPISTVRALHAMRRHRIRSLRRQWPRRKGAERSPGGVPAAADRSVAVTATLRHRHPSAAASRLPGLAPPAIRPRIVGPETGPCLPSSLWAQVAQGFHGRRRLYNRPGCRCRSHQMRR